MMSNLPSSIYIHIPFCENICSYCDFPKLQYFRNFAVNYIKCLKQELDSYNIKQPIRTIYVGGGTPTALDEDLLLELLKIIEPYTSQVEEYTFEANPESLTDNKLALLKRFNVNRLSIGIESTNDRILKALNRKYTYEDAVNAFFRAKFHGFDNLNVDLIIGLPGVSKALLRKDLDNLLFLDPQHISIYSLTVHPNTVFGINGVKEKSDDLIREYYDQVEEMLTSSGYFHYEVSNFTKVGYQSIHNMVYWKNEMYYGIGLGASGYIGNKRYTNTKSINEYLNGKTIAEEEILTLEDVREYQIMLNLRTDIGIDVNEFKLKFKEDLLKSKKEAIETFISGGLLILENNHLIATYRGMMILDQIILELL